MSARSFRNALPRLQVECLEERELLSTAVFSDTQPLSPTVAVASTLPALTPFYPGGLDPRRVPLEAQGWWPIPGNPSAFWHEHIAVLAPVGQQVTGVMHLDMRIVLHDDPGARLTVVASNDGSATGRVFNKKFTTQPPFVSDGTTRTFVQPIDIDTRWQPDGWHILSLRANVVTAQGMKFFTALEFHYYAANGNPRLDTFNGWSRGLQSWRAASWSEAAGYHRIVHTSIPLRPVSGIYQFPFEYASGNRLVIALDKSHHIPAFGPWPDQPDTPGRVLLDVVPSGRSTLVRVDTTQLQNGWHSIQSQIFTAENSHPKTVTWFYVQN